MKENPIDECLKALLKFVDISKYPDAEKRIKLMLQILLLVGKIQQAIQYK